jgi:holo-[acyl-carrier protein] synthase
MDIIGLGTDIVEISRLKKVLESHDQRFTERVFTQAERVLAEGKKESVTFYAGRWAAKEAVSKALGCGIGEHCSFTDVEILNDACGAPQVTLSGAAARRLSALGGINIHISVSHERAYAVATVIITD